MIDHSADQIGDFLFGGYSLAQKRHYRGLFHRVRRCIHAAFAEYAPTIQTASVMVVGAPKANDDGWSDPGPLEAYCRHWLYSYGDPRPGRDRRWLEEHPSPAPLQKQYLLALVAKCQRSARFHLQRVESGIGTDDELEALVGLAGALVAFFNGRESCTHKRAQVIETNSGPCQVCPTCGFAEGVEREPV